LVKAAILHLPDAKPRENCSERRGPKRKQLPAVPVGAQVTWAADEQGKNPVSVSGKHEIANGELF